MIPAQQQAQQWNSGPGRLADLPLRSTARSLTAPLSLPGNPPGVQHGVQAGAQADVDQAQPRASASGIEHRQAQRLVVQIPVILRLDHHRCAFGIARNLSRDGIFVETSATPERNCCVDLIIPGLALANNVPAALPTVLIHRTDRGLGLMFRSLDERTGAVLERLLKEARSAHLLARARDAAVASGGARLTLFS